MKRPPFGNRCDTMRYSAVTIIGFCAISLAGWPFGGRACSQNEKDKPPAAVAAKPDDVKSMDAILAAVYDTISGPAGGRDWDRLRSLFHADARLIPCVRATQDGDKQAIRARVLTVEECILGQRTPRSINPGRLSAEKMTIAPPDCNSPHSIQPTRRKSETRPVWTHSVTKMLPSLSKHASCGWRQ